MKPSRKRIALVIPQYLLQWDQVVEEFTHHIQKTMTSVLLESILEYCRIAFDILQEKIGISIFVMNDAMQLHTVLSDETIEEQNYNHACNVFANLKCNQFQIYAMDTLKPFPIIYYFFSPHQTLVLPPSSNIESILVDANLFHILIHEKLKHCFHLRSIIIQDIPLKFKTTNVENIKGDVEFLASCDSQEQLFHNKSIILKWNRQTGLGSLKTSIDHLSVSDSIYKLSPLFPCEQASMCLTKQILAAGKNVTLSQEKNPSIVSHVMKQHGNEINLHVLKKKWDMIFFLKEQSIHGNQRLETWIDDFTLYYHPSLSKEKKTTLLQTSNSTFVETSDKLEKKTRILYYLSKIISEYSNENINLLIPMIEKMEIHKIQTVLKNITQHKNSMPLWMDLRNIMSLQDEFYQSGMVAFMDEIIPFKKSEELSMEFVTVPTLPFIVPLEDHSFFTVVQWGTVLYDRFLSSTQYFISIGFKSMFTLKRIKFIFEISTSNTTNQETIDPFAKSVLFVVSAWNEESNQLLYQLASPSLESLYSLLTKQQVEIKLELLSHLFGITSPLIQEILQHMQLPYSYKNEKDRQEEEEWKPSMNLLQYKQQSSKACEFDGQYQPLYGGNNSEKQSHKYQRHMN